MDRDLRTLFCGNLSSRVSEAILYELFLQAGPLEEVKIPRDRDSRPRSYGFVTYKHPESVDYAVELFRDTSLFNKKLNVVQKVRGPPEPMAPPPALLVPMNPLAGFLPNSPYAVPIGYPMPYVFQDQNPYYNQNQNQFYALAHNQPHGYPSKDRHHSRNHPYRRN